MSLIRNSLVAAVALLLTAGSASAVSITFDLASGGDTDQASFNIFDSSSIYSLLVTGFTSGGARNIDRDSNGVGVDGGSGDSDQVDGDGPNETIRFNLGSVVAQLKQAVFTLVGSDDDFNLGVDGTYIGQADIPNSGVFNFAGTYTGSIFDFSVTQDNDDYKLSSLTFDITGSQETEVPEPMSMLLLGSGLVGVGAMRRRAKAAE